MLPPDLALENASQPGKNCPKNRSLSRLRVALGIECCGGMRPIVIMARVPKNIQLIGVPRLVKQILSSSNVGFKQRRAIAFVRISCSVTIVAYCIQTWINALGCTLLASWHHSLSSDEKKIPIQSKSLSAFQLNHSILTWKNLPSGPATVCKCVFSANLPLGFECSRVHGLLLPPELSHLLIFLSSSWRVEGHSNLKLFVNAKPLRKRWLRGSFIRLWSEAVENWYIFQLGHLWLYKGYLRPFVESSIFTNSKKECIGQNLDVLPFCQAKIFQRDRPEQATLY